MSIAPLKFTGISSFSDDFQTIVDRTVSIASLPVRALENYQQEVLADKAALGSLSTAIASLVGDLNSLASMGSGGALSVSSSSGKVSASIGSGAAPGVYVISDIGSLAQSAVYTANAGLPDTMTTAVDSDGVINFVVDGTNHEITLGEGENSLAGLRDAINGSGLGFTASIVDRGSGADRYFLTLTSDRTGERSCEILTESALPASNLISETRAGSDATFKLNGIDITSKDNQVSGVIPGVNFLLKDLTSTDEEIVLTVKTDTSPVATALARFAGSYNELAALVSQHRGDAGGSLAGNGIALDLASRLMALTGVSSAGAVRSLSDLGLTLDLAGTMSYDSSKVRSMGSDEFNSALEFLASKSGGLASMGEVFELFSDPDSGLIQSEIALLNRANDRYSEQISKATERIDTMQAALLSKLQAADTLLASLDAQKSMLTATLESLSTVTNGRRNG